MMARYLALQQQALAELGERRAALQADLQREQLRVRQLGELLANLGVALDLRQGLVRDNYYQMQRNMQRLLSQQQDKAAVAEQALAVATEELRVLLGRVKGLELLLRQRESALQTRQLRREQQQLDEFNTVRYQRG